MIQNTTETIILFRRRVEMNQHRPNRLVLINEVYILSGPSMKYGRPEAHASFSHSGFVLRQYQILWKKRCHTLF